MEELIVLPFTLVVVPLVYFIADLFGLCMGLGWRHYSKKRKQRKLEARQRIETFK